MRNKYINFRSREGVYKDSCRLYRCFQQKNFVDFTFPRTDHSKDTDLLPSLIHVRPHIISNGNAPHKKNNDQNNDRRFIHHLIGFDLCGNDLIDGCYARIRQNVP